MAASVTVLKNAKIFVDSMDLSAQENEVQLSMSCDEKEKTCYNDSAHINAPGLFKYGLSHKGFLAYGTASIEEQLRALKGVSNVPVTLSMPGSEGSIAYFLKAAQFGLNGNIKMGELSSFDMNMSPTAIDVYRGILLENAAASKSSSSNGNGRNYGAASAAQYLYAVLHVLELTDSETIDVIIESSSDAGFSAPTTRVTFAQATAMGSELAARVAGPITDTYYRVSWALSGGSAKIAVAMAIA